MEHSITYLRTSSPNPDFRKLVVELDAELRIRDGEDHAFYALFNSILGLKYVIVAYDGPIPVGCGSLKEYTADTMEVKRMYVLESYRSKGIASQILHELETWARELNYSRCILETGLRQPEAIRLYEKNGYHRIENYGQYGNLENSVCFEKILS